MNPMQAPRIAIVGGGPAGLVLARILQTRGTRATVFERDRSPSDRPQGGTLDLHVVSGQHALRLAGLEREFLTIARYEDQGSRLYDPQGALRFDDPGEGGDRPEVDRTALRALLLDSLEESTVRWGCRVPAVEPTPDGGFSVEGECFDLVVGADGAWSRVRPLVSNARPAYSGITFYEFGIDDVDRRHPELARLVGRGKMFALGGGRALVAQRNGNAHVRVGAALPVPEEEIGAEVSTAKVIRQYAGWSDSLLGLVLRGERLRTWPIFALPVGHAWEHRPGVTLVGDAAHLMSPFSGEGVNLAMLDAAELALAILDGSDLRGFEATMTERAAREAFGAAMGLEGTFGPNAVEDALEWMAGHRNVE